MKYLVIFLTIVFVLSTHYYLYNRGLMDGEQNYKDSHRMYLALKSAYHFGYFDAKNNEPENWDGN